MLYTRDETRAGFFKAEKLTADLKLVNQDGNEFAMQRVFPDIKERYFYKIKYSLDDGGDNEEAGADFGGIIVDERPIRYITESSSNKKIFSASRFPSWHLTALRKIRLSIKRLKTRQFPNIL